MPVIPVVVALVSLYSKFEKFGAACVASVEKVIVFIVESPPFGVVILACKVMFESVGKLAMKFAVVPTATLIVPKLIHEE